MTTPDELKQIVSQIETVDVEIANKKHIEKTLLMQPRTRTSTLKHFNVLSVKDVWMHMRLPYMNTKSRNINWFWVCQ